MAKDQGIIQTALRRRTPLRATPNALAVDQSPKKRFDPVQFLREVRIEARKITWTTWKETWITSVMVAIMVILTATFFFGLDGVLSVAINALLKLANAE